MSILEFVAALAGVVSVYLAARENIWNWPMAMVNLVLYPVVFQRTGLYSDMGSARREVYSHEWSRTQFKIAPGPLSLMMLLSDAQILGEVRQHLVCFLVSLLARASPRLLH